MITIVMLLITFFSHDDLSFRAVIATGKSRLQHNEFNQTHDDWYYKMYFLLLRKMMSPDGKYKVFVDIKDTRGGQKTAKLKEILNNSLYTFYEEAVNGLQQIQSEESELIQLADLFIGAISYVNRGFISSRAKLALIQKIIHYSGMDLKQSTPLCSDKINLFKWCPREVL